jgi:ribosome-associated protein
MDGGRRRKPGRPCSAPRGPVYSGKQPLSRGGTQLSKTVPAEIRQTVDAALDKKAEDLVVLDLRNLSDVTDFFVICHGTSDRQAVTIADSIEQRLHEALGIRPASVEGRRTGEWILMDYIDFVVHVFVEEKREFYRLERLWGDAPQIEAGQEASVRQSSA